MRVRVIIVNYNSGEHLRACLDSLFRHEPADSVAVTVIDNASNDDSIAQAEALESPAQFIRNAANLGFAVACNQAAEAASEPYLFFVNPDLVFTQAMVAPIAALLHASPRVQAAGPKLLNDDGSLQPSRGGFPTLLKTIPAIFRWKDVLPKDEVIIRMLGPLAGKLFPQYRPLPETVEEVDYLTGACLMVRRDSFQAIGGFDPQFFLYYDEIDLCKRLPGPTVFLPSISARHQVAASSLEDPYFIRYHRRRSMLRYFEKHHPPWQARALRWVLLLERRLLREDTPFAEQYRQRLALMGPHGVASNELPDFIDQHQEPSNSKEPPCTSSPQKR